MRHVISLIILLLSFFLSHSQDINGIWRGRLVMDPGGCFPVYDIELQVQVNGAKIQGYSYHYSDTTNYVRENFDGRYVVDSNLLLLNEIGVTTFHIPPDCIPCIKKFTLSYHKGINEEQLRGAWTGRTMDNKTNCPPGTIVLSRVPKSDFKPIVPTVLVERKNELVKEIKVDTGTIRIDFYDNGIIDGDTISVYVNNMPVVSRRVLAAKPVTVFVKIDLKKAEQEVIMVGENMGTIPPNTALMIINAKEKRYQLYLTSDEKRNALVRFIYERPGVAKSL